MKYLFEEVEWLDEKTLALILDINVLNPSTNLLVEFKLVFTFSFTGTVSLNYDSYVLHYSLFDNQSSIQIGIALFIFSICLALVSFFDVRKLVIKQQEVDSEQLKENEEKLEELKVVYVENENKMPKKKKSKKEDEVEELEEENRRLIFKKA